MEAMETDTRRTANTAPPEHEQSDVSVKGIGVFLAILAGFAVILHFGLAGIDLILKKLTRNQDQQQSGLVADPVLARARPNFPEPRLQVAPRGHEIPTGVVGTLSRASAPCQSECHRSGLSRPM